MRRGVRALGAAALAVLATGAGAEPVTLGRVTFSDELGGVVLRGGWGAGTAADPFVLVEEITDDGPAVLVLRGVKDHLGDPLAGSGQHGFHLTKIVTNATERPWTSFELELRERLEEPSSYEDGLSFGQASWDGRAFGADLFATVSATDEPLDAVVFSEGVVAPGQTVTVSVLVTDYTPRQEFFLLQRREAPVAALLPRAAGG